MKIIIMEGKRFERRKLTYRRYIYRDLKIRRWKGKYRYLFCILFRVFWHYESCIYK